jgi:hypothetical protein
MGRNDLTMRKIRLFASVKKRKECKIEVLSVQPRYTDYRVDFYFSSYHIRVEGGKVWRLGFWSYPLKEYTPIKSLLGILTH